MTVFSRGGFVSRGRNKDAEGTWREKTQWHICVAYRPTADYAPKIQTGAHVFLEGELIYGEYDRTIEAESGPVKVPFPVTEILVESPTVLKHPAGAGMQRGRVSDLSITIL